MSGFDIDKISFDEDGMMEITDMALLDEIAGGLRDVGDDSANTNCVSCNGNCSC